MRVTSSQKRRTIPTTSEVRSLITKQDHKAIQQHPINTPKDQDPFRISNSFAELLSRRDDDQSKHAVYDTASTGTGMIDTMGFLHANCTFI